MGTIVRMIFAASLLLLPAAVPGSAFSDVVPGDGGAASKALPPAAKNPEDPVPRDLRLKNAGVIGGIGLAVGIVGANSWWKEGLSGSFRTADEGWFGENTYAGGGDKAGHVFFTYTGSRVLARGFEALGNEPGRSLRLGAWTLLGVMTGVEIVDGFSKRFRFSLEDALANVSGVAFAVLLEKYPALDALVDFRLLYRRSADARRVGETDPIADYSGQLFLLAFKADGVPAFRDLPVARYLELQVGYNTHGYEPNDGVKVDPHRRIYYGVGINLSRLLGDTVFRGDLKDGRIQRGADTFLEFLQIPGTAALTYRRL